MDKRALREAQALEKGGQHEAAARAYRDLGAVDDAARAFGSARKPREGAELLLSSLGVQPAQVGQLDAAMKKRALMAAILFGKAGDAERAVELFLGLGERARAVDALRRAGDHLRAARIEALPSGEFAAAAIVSALRPGPAASAMPAVGDAASEKLEATGKLQAALEAFLALNRFGDAARVARKLGRTAEAAQLYGDAGMPYEAAECHRALEEPSRQLDALVRVARDDPRYRAAAVQAVELAARLSSLTFPVEHFLGSFLKSGPRDPNEVAAFRAAARLYRAHGLNEHAAEALRHLARAAPGDAEVAAELADLEALSRPSALVARHVLSDAELHRRMPAGMPALPDLPDIEGGSGPPPQRAEGNDDAQPTMNYARPPAPAPDPVTEQLAPPAAPGPAPAPIDLGSVIAGRYRLEAKLGEGGMAIVYRAHDLDLDEDVALKIFPDGGTDQLVARFKQELKLSRQLQHPNVIRLHDIGVHQGRRYISMELLLGQTLKQRLRAPMEVREAVGWLLQACEGLQAAHDKGVIHRDVKPDNFFLTAAGLLKILDFGIAKQHAAPGLTMAGAVAGTPTYMSPEQVTGFSTVTHATDLYALGVCAYEMLTGNVPFAHADLIPLLMMHIQNAPDPLRARNPRVPEALEKIVLRLLDKDPARRFASCRDLATALRAAQ